MGWTTGLRFPAEARHFSLLYSFQTGSLVHLASYIMGTRGSFLGDKVAGGVKLTTHLHLVLRSRMVELYLQPPHVLMVWCLINYAQGQCYLFIAFHT
jgi:hypothetical protein